MERLYVGNVCSSIEHMVDHIERHNLELDPNEYLDIANNALSLGVDMGNGILLTEFRGRVWRVVVRGEIDDHRIVRSVLDKGPLRDDMPHPGYWIKVKQPRVKTYIKPMLPDWSLTTVSEAISRLAVEGDEQKGSSFRYSYPLDHIVSVRKKTPKTLFK